MICRSSRCRSKTGNYRETLLDRLSTHPGSRSAARGSRWSVSSAVSPGLSGGKTTLDLGQEDLQKLLGRVVHAATLVLGHMALDLDLEHRRMMPELFPSATGFGDPPVIEEEAVMDHLCSLAGVNGRDAAQRSRPADADQELLFRTQTYLKARADNCEPCS